MFRRSIEQKIIALQVCKAQLAGDIEQSKEGAFAVIEKAHADIERYQALAEALASL